MKSGYARRLASLEQQAPSKSRRTFVDPVTGEEVEFKEIANWATSGDLRIGRLIRLAQIGEIDTALQHDGDCLPSEAVLAVQLAESDQLEAWWRDLMAVWFDRRRRREPEWWQRERVYGAAAKDVPQWPIPRAEPLA